MFKFHYDTIKQQYPGANSALCFTDTDSFLYRIKTDDIYADMLQNYQQYDFSAYADDHPCFKECPIPTKYIKSLNKKIVGKFKDEENVVPITEFVGIRAKCYSYITIGGVTTKKLKGIKKSVVKKAIQHEHYKHCLLNNETLHASMNTFRSYKHHIKTIRQCKSALVNFDDKRFILDDKVKTLAHGHYAIANM